MREIRVLNYLILLSKFLKLLQTRTSYISMYVCVYIHTHTLIDTHTFSQDMTVTQSVEVTPFSIFETSSIQPQVQVAIIV